MKALFGRMAAHPKFARLFRWVILLSVTSAAQMFIQGIGLLSGLLIIQLVSPKEYALYTLAYAMLGTIAAVADGGVSNGVLANGARTWQSKGALGSVMVTGMNLRKKFSIATFVISLPILFYLLIRHDSGWIVASLIVLALIPAFYALLSEDLLGIPARLNQDMIALQKNSIMANVARLIMLAGTLFFLPFTVIAILANGIPRIWANFRLRKIAEKYADLKAPPDPEVKKDILSMVRRTLPGTLYYCIAGQISIWLISIYGNTSSIAEIGALGRLAAILTVISSVFGALISPWFARLPNNSTDLLKAFIGICLGSAFFVVVIPALVYMFPTQSLFLLGRNYSNLTHEVFLSALGSCILMMVGFLYSCSIARGWIISPIISIPLSIAAQIIFILMLDLSTTRNVLLCAILNATWGIVMYSSYFLFRIFMLRKQEATNVNQ